MKCPHCKTDIVKRSASGDTMLRGKGLVLKSHGLVIICPSCTKDVPLDPEAMHAVHRVAVLFFQGKRS